MTRNELITPDGEPRCRQLQVGEEYQIGDWWYRAPGEKVFITQHSLDLLGASVGLRFVAEDDLPTFRNIEEQPK